MEITETSTGWTLSIDGEHIGTFGTKFDAQKAIHTFRTTGVIIHTINEERRYGTALRTPEATQVGEAA